MPAAEKRDAEDILARLNDYVARNLRTRRTTALPDPELDAKRTDVPAVVDDLLPRRD